MWNTWARSEGYSSGVQRAPTWEAFFHGCLVWKVKERFFGPQNGPQNDCLTPRLGPTPLRETVKRSSHSERSKESLFESTYTATKKNRRPLSRLPCVFDFTCNASVSPAPSILNCEGCCDSTTCLRTRKRGSAPARA